MSTFAVFETSYAKNNQETLRWASVALAALLAIICLIWAGVVTTKNQFKDDMSAAGENKAFRILMVALYFLIVVAATFLSWFVASLHIGKNNLIALDVLNFVVAVCLGFATYFYYKNNNSSPSTARSFMSIAVVLEFVALIVLMISPQTAGSAGSLVQSTLYVPLLVSTLWLMGYH